VKKIMLLCGVATLACLSACGTPQQNAQLLTGLDIGCHVASAVELADPALSSHNPQVVNGATLLCATAPAFIPPPPAVVVPMTAAPVPLIQPPPATPATS
jgi:hypothetical protein